MKPDALGDWRRTHHSTAITPDLDGVEVTVFGWVSGVRDLGAIRFIILSDKEGTVQITIPPKAVPQLVLERLEGVKKQYPLGVRGVVKKSDKAQRGVEIIPREVKVLNAAEHPLGLDPTGRVPADIDVRLNARVLDLCRPEGRAVFRVNHHALQAMRGFFSGEGFIEVQTPKIIATATEGGAALFPVIYFDREAFLAQSPQLYKEQLTIPFERVFEIGQFFRAEESNTTRHTSEFISVDIEEAFATAEDVMGRLERMVTHVISTVRERCREELKALGHKLEVPPLPFKRYRYDEILAELKEGGLTIPWGEDISTQALRTVGERHPGEYFFITDWPTKIKAFYIKPRDEKPEVSEGFDLMYGWIELASGGTRIHDKELLMKRMREQGLNPSSFEYHLKVFEEGMPPHAGWGLGMARFLMALTGRENIRECVLFPRDRYRLTP